MHTSRRLRWLRAVLLLGVVYLVTGVTFAALANGAGSNQMRVTWRLAAWGINAAAFAAHIGNEHLQLRRSPPTPALDPSLAVALGAFPRALAGMGHARAAPRPQQSPPPPPRLEPAG